MTAERQSLIDATPHKTAWMAIAASVVFHAVGLAAIASWPTNSMNSYVRFAGREQAFQVTLSLAEPQWNVDPVALDDFEIDLPVVIEPDKARIGRQTYVQAPTVEILADELLLDSAIDQPLPKPLAPRTPTRAPPTDPKTSTSAVAVPPSNLGNTEDVPPDLSQNSPPTYPVHAIQSGWKGTVLLRIWIDEAGRVTKVEVARTSGYPLLDGAAVAAVRQWKAIPANRGGTPASTVELLPVRFKL